MSGKTTRILLAALWLAAPAPPFARAEEPKISVRDPAEALILSIETERRPLLEATVAYQHQTGLLLSLADAVEALEFPVDVDPVAGKATGWFLEPDRDFSLDMEKGEVVVEGKKSRYDPALVELLPDGLYVDASLLSKWFPVDFTPELPRSRVVIKGREKLPAELREDREVKRARLGSSAEDRELPSMRTPYALFSLPKADVDVGYGYAGENERFSANQSLSLVGDMLHSTGRLYVSGDEMDAINNVRFSLSREDPDRSMTALGLSEFEVGDVYAPAMKNFTAGTSGRGVTFSNFPLDAARDFDSVTLEGDLQAGWEVELYRNDSLIDFRSVPDAGGRYIFENVDLLYGRNVFRLVFYGPQGQTREETRVYSTGAESAPKGERYFSVTALQDDTPLLDFVNDRTPFQERDPDLGEGRVVADYRYGITERLSAGAAFASTSAEGERANVARAGLTASLGPTLTQVNVFGNMDAAAVAAEITTQFSVLGNGINLSYAQFGDEFLSDYLVTDGSQDVIAETADGRLDGSFGIGDLPRVSYGFAGDYEKYRSGKEILQYGNRISSTVSKVNFSHRFDGTKIYGQDIFGSDTLLGSALLNVRTRPKFLTYDGNPVSLSLRGGFQYYVRPTVEAQRASFVSDFYLNDRTGLQFAVDRMLGEDDETFYSAGAHQDFTHFLGSLAVGYSDEGNFIVGLFLNFSIDYNRMNADPWSVTPYGRAEDASLLSRVFLDNDGDGAYTAGTDDPIRNASLRLGGRGDSERSDDDGFVRLAQLQPNAGANVSLAEDSLEDPYQTSTFEGRQIVPRPAERMRLDFPVRNTGEADGYVYIAKDGVKTPLNKLPIELVDEAGKVAKTEKSAFDGFYVFTKILPGAYTLRVSPEKLAKLGVPQPEPKRVVISDGDDNVVSGIEIVLGAEAP
ncbi:MAG: hypothetical protein ABW189_04565 [Rickettsiales bacterium]